MSEMIRKAKIRKCFITHITIDAKAIEIWAQTDPNSAERVQSLLQLNHIYFSDLFAIRKQNKQKPEVGKFYVTHKKSDLHFYRSVVTHFESNSSQALVLFIDFGFEEWVPINWLIVCDDIFNEKPLAYKYLLADIRPNDKKGWDTDEVKRSLSSFIGCVFDCEVVQCNQNTECIRIYEQNLEQPLVDKLIEECNGVLHIQKTNNGKLQTNDLSVKTIIQDIKHIQTVSEAHSSKNIQINSNSIESNRNANVIKVSHSTNTVVKTINVKDKIVSTPSPQSLTTHLSNLLGLKKIVYITFSVTTKSIYCQLKEKYDEIQEIVEKMTKHYEKIVDTKELELSDEMKSTKGVIIAARFSIDNNWYRASILSTDDNLVDVLYIDFGNTERIQYKYCRELVKEFQNIPPQAMHCSPINTDLSFFILKEYETNGQEIECEFVKLEGDIFKVKLYENGIIISDKQIHDKSTKTNMNTNEKNVNHLTDTKVNKIETEDKVVSTLPPQNSLINGNSIESDMSKNESNLNHSNDTEIVKIEAQNKTDSTLLAQNNRIKCDSIQSDMSTNEENMNHSSNTFVKRNETIDEFVSTHSSITHLSNLLGFKKIVYITSLVSTKSIYCQLKEKYDEIQEVVEKMTKHYEKIVDTKELELSDEMKSTKGVIIAARFSIDDNWYRASILSTDDNLVDVLYIDFGNTERIQYKYCRQLVKEFQNIPPQAMHCSPINKDLNFFILKEYETNEKEIECEFVKLEGDILKVKLYENGIIISHKQIHDKSMEKKLNTNEKNVNHLTDTKVNKIETEDKVFSTLPSQNSLINGNSIESDMSTNESNLNNNEVKRIDSEDEIVSMQSLTAHLSSLLEMKKMVYITSVTPKSIYCQLKEKYDETQEVIEKMTKHYEKIVETKELELSDEMKSTKGVIIAARFSIDENWYRASILSTDDNLVDVFYIDFGNKEVVEYKYCRELLDEFSNLAPQAIHCSLINTDLNLTVLKEYEINGEEIECEFIELEGDILKVNLYENGVEKQNSNTQHNTVSAINSISVNSKSHDSDETLKQEVFNAIQYCLNNII